jgi:hypothetical protein
MIPESLSKFDKLFHLEQAKDVMPYCLYTKEFVASGCRATREQLTNVPEVKQTQALFNNLDKWELWDEDNKADMLAYTVKYCEIDLRVLSQGYGRFRSMVLGKYDLDTFHFPTISGLADR